MRIRVIVAEDERTIREALTDLIQAAPTLDLVSAVDDATQAVRVAAVLQPDVAVVDVRMPGGGGPEAARGIIHRSPSTRVLAHSAAGDRASVVEMLEAGAVGYLIKGVDPGRIVESIESAAAGQGTLSAEVTADVIEELVERRTGDRREAEQRRAIRERLERTLKDRGALRMVFQPIWELEHERVVAAEALARFRGPPEQGPDRWFAEATDAGLGVELELAAAQRAVDELANLPQSVDLSLNASPESAGSSRFLDLLARIESRRIIVEITEHARIDDYDELGTVLSELGALGIRIAVDDAGAGFASLRHILRLDPQFIKLDRTLTENIATDRSRQALAAGLISFADKTGATIVAEGIECHEEMDVLRGLGVAYGQGFFLARPAPLPLPVFGPPNT
jgi:EAL domain-containing protein (putative c-di-GMP-specific phosphodiesterase class I)/CheY-like chemotaxis protein